MKLPSDVEDRVEKAIREGAGITLSIDGSGRTAILRVQDCPPLKFGVTILKNPSLHSIYLNKPEDSSIRHIGYVSSALNILDTKSHTAV